MTALYGGYTCCDPVTEMESARSLGMPTSPWYGEANSFESPAGPGPGRGMLLMAWRDLSRLDREASHDLVFADGYGQRVTLKSIIPVRAFACTPGARSDPSTVFWLEVADKRLLAASGGILNKSYNVPDGAGGYLSASKNSGSAWTWATMLADVWAANGFLGTNPGLPFTPDGTPEGFVFWGVPSFTALNDILDRVGCVLTLDQTLDTYAIERLAGTDADAEAALASADGRRIWDACPIEPARAKLPEKVRVHFPVSYAGGDSTGASPYYPLDRTDPTAGGAVAGVEPNTIVGLLDDMTALYDATPTLTNAVALGFRADERAADYYRRMRLSRLSRRYSGSGAGSLMPGPLCKSVVWASRGAAEVTDFLRHPGYGPAGMTLTGARGGAEPGLAVGADGLDGMAGAAGAGGMSGAGGLPGGAGRSGANGVSIRGVPGMPGGRGASGLLALLWPVLGPAVRLSFQQFLAVVTNLNLVLNNLTVNGRLIICGPQRFCRSTMTIANGANTISLSGLTSYVQRLTGPSGAWSIASITGASDGDSYLFYNATGQTGTLPLSAGIFSISSDVVVPSGASFGLTYDSTSSLFRITSPPTVSTPISGSGTPYYLARMNPAGTAFDTTTGIKAQTSGLLQAESAVEVRDFLALVDAYAGTPTTGQWVMYTDGSLVWHLARSGVDFLTLTTAGVLTLVGTGSVFSLSGASAFFRCRGLDGVTGTSASGDTVTGGIITAVSTLAALKTALLLTGTNSGDQTITLTGDVTGSGTGSFAATIAAGAVTLAKMANMATASLIYRKTAGSGVPEVNTLATLKTDLALAAIATSGSASDLSAGTVPAARMPALTGEVTSSAGAVATTLNIAGMSIKHTSVLPSDLVPVRDAATTSNKAITFGDFLGGMPVVTGGRLTLTTGVPVTGSDVASSTAVMFTPYLNNLIQLWDGTNSNWVAIAFAEAGVNGASIGTLTSGKNYDVFGYLTIGALACESLAWTNDSTRATGVSLQDGRYCKTGDKTRLYLGTFRTISTTATCDTAAQRFLWNMYNRRPYSGFKTDNADSWTYNGNGTWRGINNGAAPWKHEFVCGMQEDAWTADIDMFGVTPYVATIAIDSTTAPDRAKASWITFNSATAINSSARFADMPAAGYHFIQGIETTSTSGTGTAYGDNGGGVGGGSVGVNTGMRVTGWR